MEDYRGSEDILVEVGELETYLIGPTDVAGVVGVSMGGGGGGGGCQSGEPETFTGEMQEWTGWSFNM